MRGLKRREDTWEPTKVAEIELKSLNGPAPVIVYLLRPDLNPDEVDTIELGLGACYEAAFPKQPEARQTARRLELDTGSVYEVGRPDLAKDENGIIFQRVFMRPSHSPAFRCPVCKAQQSSLQALIYHLDETHNRSNRQRERRPPPRTMFSCQHCGEKFDLKMKLNIHIKHTHGRLRQWSPNRSKTSETSSTSDDDDDDHPIRKFDGFATARQSRSPSPVDSTLVKRRKDDVQADGNNNNNNQNCVSSAGANDREVISGHGSRSRSLTGSPQSRRRSTRSQSAKRVKIPARRTTGPNERLEPIKCFHCRKMCRDEAELTKHIELTHMFRCLICSHTFKKQSMWTRHVKVCNISTAR